MCISLRVQIVSKVKFVFILSAEMKRCFSLEKTEFLFLLHLHLNCFHQISTFKSRFKYHRCIFRIPYRNRCWSTPFSISPNTRSNKLNILVKIPFLPIEFHFLHNHKFQEYNYKQLDHCFHRNYERMVHDPLLEMNDWREILGKIIDLLGL